jgi:hypothetical protein
MVNLEHCVNSIFELFFQMLTEEEKQMCISHRVTSQSSVEALYGNFGERLISWGFMAALFARFECV